MVFSSLGPSLNSRNLTLNRATGLTDDGRGVGVPRGIGLEKPWMVLQKDLAISKDFLWIAVVAIKLVFHRY